MKAEDRLWNAFVSAMVGVVLFFITLLVVLSLVGCKTKYVSVPEYHTEYVYRTDSVEKWDSIFCHDSVYVMRDGDTITMYKYREKAIYKYLDRVRVDSFFKTDSIRVPYPVKVKKKLSLWQKVRMRTGEGAMVLLVILAGIVAIRRR